MHLKNLHQTPSPIIPILRGNHCQYLTYSFLVSLSTFKKVKIALYSIKITFQSITNYTILYLHVSFNITSIFLMLLIFLQTILMIEFCTICMIFPLCVIKYLICHFNCILMLFLHICHVKIG